MPKTNLIRIVELLFGYYRTEPQISLLKSKVLDILRRLKISYMLYFSIYDEQLD